MLPKDFNERFHREFVSKYYLTPLEFAKKYNVTRWAVYKWLYYGYITNYVKDRGRYYIWFEESRPERRLSHA